MNGPSHEFCCSEGQITNVHGNSKTGKQQARASFSLEESNDWVPLSMLYLKASLGPAGRLFLMELTNVPGIERVHGKEGDTGQSCSVPSHPWETSDSAEIALQRSWWETPQGEGKGQGAWGSWKDSSETTAGQGRPGSSLDPNTYTRLRAKYQFSHLCVTQGESRHPSRGPESCRKRPREEGRDHGGRKARESVATNKVLDCHSSLWRRESSQPH